ncbi:DUF1648 domain-containing protein [Streptomyces sp. NBC_00726]|uniref:DUF1648 domain-containing protein n=1 Tax=Streptomyces sp. NBC_00726 TaxID=2903674 RepID=UPI00386A4F18
MNLKSIGRVALTALPFLLALAVDLLLFATRRDRLPARLASHFVGNGRVDDYAGQTSYLVATTLVLLGVGLLWVLAAGFGKFAGTAYRVMVALGYGFAAFLGYLMGAVLLINVDAVEDAQGRGQGVHFPMWHMAAAFGAGVVAFGIGYLAAMLTPVPGPVADDGPEGDGERIALGAGEVAGWGRGAGSWWLPLTGLLVIGTGIAMLFTASWPFALLPLVLGLLIAAFARPYVTVDRRGIIVSGLLPRPRIRIPLDRIEAAASRDIRPLSEYGGWGYRIRPGRSGVIIRSGEGIVARLTNGRDFAVTVDDSATGAALLNTLIDRRRAER